MAGQCSELGKKSKVAWLNDLVSSAAIWFTIMHPLIWLFSAPTRAANPSSRASWDTLDLVGKSPRIWRSSFVFWNYDLLIWRKDSKLRVILFLSIHSYGNRWICFDLYLRDKKRSFIALSSRSPIILAPFSIYSVSTVSFVKYRPSFIILFTI